MPLVACPSCGERGKIPESLVGSRIKCRKCGNGFNVAPAPAKAATPAKAAAPATASSSTPAAHDGIAVEGLEASAWTEVPEHSPDALTAHVQESHPETVDSTHFTASGPGAMKEYKLLTSRDKIFEGKFDLARLEEALNYHAREGWVVKTMSTPQVKGYGGVLQEEIVVILER